MPVHRRASRMPVHPREGRGPGSPPSSAAMTVMSRRPATLVLAVSVALAALAGTAPGWAQDPPRERRDDARQQRAERGSDRDRASPNRNRDALSDSVRRFERNHRNSRVLSVERMHSDDGRDLNRIKAMDDRGRVRVYVDDPQRRPPPPPRRPTRDDHD